MKKMMMISLALVGLVAFSCEKEKILEDQVIQEPNTAKVSSQRVWGETYESTTNTCHSPAKDCIVFTPDEVAATPYYREFEKAVLNNEIVGFYEAGYGQKVICLSEKEYYELTNGKKTIHKVGLFEKDVKYALY